MVSVLVLFVDYKKNFKIFIYFDDYTTQSNL